MSVIRVVMFGLFPLLAILAWRRPWFPLLLMLALRDAPPVATALIPISWWPWEMYAGVLAMIGMVAGFKKIFDDPKQAGYIKALALAGCALSFWTFFSSMFTDVGLSESLKATTSLATSAYVIALAYWHKPIFQRGMFYIVGAHCVLGAIIVFLPGTFLDVFSAHVQLPDVASTDPALVYSSAVNFNEGMRFYGQFWNPVLLGVYGAAGVVLSAYWMLTGRFWIKLLSIVFLISGVMVTIAAGVKGPIIGAALGLFVIILANLNWRKLFGIIVLIAVLISIPTVALSMSELSGLNIAKYTQFIFDRFDVPAFNSSVQIRLSLTDVSLGYMLNSPLVGAGPLSGISVNVGGHSSAHQLNLYLGGRNGIPAFLISLIITLFSMLGILNVFQRKQNGNPKDQKLVSAERAVRSLSAAFSIIGFVQVMTNPLVSLGLFWIMLASGPLYLEGSLFPYRNDKPSSLRTNPYLRKLPNQISW